MGRLFRICACVVRGALSLAFLANLRLDRLKLPQSSSFVGRRWALLVSLAKWVKAL